MSYENTGNLSNVTFIFDWCPHSLAVATPVKYECDFKVSHLYLSKIKTIPSWEIMVQGFGEPHA